jgi:hypothetical protein
MSHPATICMPKSLSRLVEQPAAVTAGYEWMHAIRWGVVVDRVVWTAITVVLAWYFWP